MTERRAGNKEKERVNLGLMKKKNDKKEDRGKETGREAAKERCME